MIALVLMIASSLGCGGESGKVKRAGRAVGETVTDFTRGVGAGIDKRLEVEVDLSPAVVDLGLSKTVAKSAGIDTRGVSVYLMSQKPMTGKFVAKALNADGQEIGRSVVEVEFSADDAKYVTFRFGDEMDSQSVERYVIDVKQVAESPEKEVGLE